MIIPATADQAWGAFCLSVILFVGYLTYILVQTMNPSDDDRKDDDE